MGRRRCFWMGGYRLPHCFLGLFLSGRTRWRGERLSAVSGGEALPCFLCLGQALASEGEYFPWQGADSSPDPPEEQWAQRAAVGTLG